MVLPAHLPGARLWTNRPMKHDKEHSLIYHSLHSRPMPGCMPLFMLLSALFLGGAMLLIQVVMPERIRPQGEGNLYYRDDAILRHQINQRSPLPLRLPESLDPTKENGAAASTLSWVKPVSLLPLFSPRIYSPAPDSAVLNAQDLLALPPVQQYTEPSPAQSPEPITPTP